MEDCCGRKKLRSEEERRALVNRLSRIEGQIRGLRSMVEKDAYCADILTQSAAASAALDAFNRELLTRHIRTCVAEDLRAGREDSAEELAELLKKLM
ncbi:MAG: metal-sensing transcriptional repressor [bacterium]